MKHESILTQEILALLRPIPSKEIVDCTFGGGGHSLALLRHGAKVIGIDRDYSAYLYGKKLESLYTNFTMHLDKFSNLRKYAQKVDGVLIDAGVSTMQLKTYSRGFSFEQEGPLLMTMGLNHTTAEEIVNTYAENIIADIIYYYGNEPRSRAIAKAIAKERKVQRITTTDRLAHIVESSTGKRKNYRRHPATKTFQALRIVVNKELQELRDALYYGSKITKIFTVISFHSGEDRLVKKSFKESMYPICKKPITPTTREIALNRKARSSKLRAAYNKGI